MSVKDLRVLATNFGLADEAYIKKAKKEELIALISDWEVRELSTKSEISNEITEITPEFVAPTETFEGKKVLSVEDKELNGKTYKSITVEGGVTYMVAK